LAAGRPSGKYYIEDAQPGGAFNQGHSSVHCWASDQNLAVMLEDHKTGFHIYRENPGGAIQWIGGLEGGHMHLC